jgi:hypothetical protein
MLAEAHRCAADGGQDLRVTIDGRLHKLLPFEHHDTHTLLAAAAACRDRFLALGWELADDADIQSIME